jgi:VanZ family protein
MQKLETVLIPAYKRLPYRENPLFRAVAAAAYSALLTVLLIQSSAQPLVGPAAPREFNLAWEILLFSGHVLGFGALVTVCWWALSSLAPFRRALVTAVIFACGVGLVTELLQAFVPDRSASLFDLLVNVAASMLAACVITMRVRYQEVEV